MTKRDESQEIQPLAIEELELIEQKLVNVSELLWKTRDDGLIPLKMMEDSHLRNTALMLMGMGYQKYNAPDDLKIRWLTVLRLEWKKRMEERKASFNGMRNMTADIRHKK